MVRAGERPTISFGGKGMSEYLLTPAHERRVQAILSDIAPGGGSGDEQYALPADVELVFVIAGRLEITIDEELIVLEAGDAFTFTASARHAFRAHGGRADPGAVGGLPRAARHDPLSLMAGKGREGGGKWQRGWATAPGRRA